jgi:Mg-chelatase subunit ChlD
LFGDPTYLTGQVEVFPFTKQCIGFRGSWVRGTGPCFASGVFDFRLPHIPADMDGRVGSWCRDGDGSCTGIANDILLSTAPPDGQHDKYFTPAADAAMAMREATSHLKTFIPAHADELDDSFREFATGDAGADFVFIFDTTGSMSGAIDDMKAQATSLAQLWLSASTNGRVALVDYKDVDQGDPYAARVDLDLTSDVDAFQSAVDALFASGGGDTPEAQLSGIMAALNGLAWQPGATKVALVITDAPGKDPEPVTGYTDAQVEQRALDIDPVAIYGVDVLGDSQVSGFMQPLADATAGQVYTLGAGQTLSDLLGDVIDTVALNPVADMGGPYLGQTGTAVHFYADRSYDPDGTIASYEWDFDADGSVDQTTSVPTVDHTYTADYAGQAALRVIATDGGEAIDTADVAVDANGPVDAVPVSPVEASATVTGADEVTVSWTRAPDDRATGFTATLVDTDFTRATTTGTSIVITGLDLTQPIAFDIRSQNDFGPSAPIRTNSVGGSEPSWQAFERVDDDTTQQEQILPSLAMAPDGTAFAAWTDDRSGSTWADIYSARRDPITAEWGPNEHVNDDGTTASKLYVSVAVDSANNAYAVWVDERNGRKDIYFSKRLAATGQWSPNVRVNTSTAGDPDHPDIAVATNGDAVAVWQGSDSHRKASVQAARLPAGGSVWSPETTVTGRGAAPDFPRVVVGADGTAYAVWEDQRNHGDNDIYFSSLPSSSSVWTTNVKVSDDPGTFWQTSPDLGVDSTGSLTAVWTDWRSQPNLLQLRASRRVAGGSTWSPSVLISGNGGNEPSVAVRPDGRAIVAWYDGLNSFSPNEWASDYDPSSATWLAPTQVTSTGWGFNPGVGINSSGELVLYYGSNTAGDEDIRAQFRSLTGGG